MFRLVKKHPATFLFLLATALGAAPLALVAAGLLPASFNQLGALSASAAGITLAAIDGGKKSVRDLLGRVLIWRVNAGWWLFVLLFPAVLTVGSLYLAGALSGKAASLPGVGPLYSLVPLLLFLIVFAGLGEEFGWRGFAVPRSAGPAQRSRNEPRHRHSPLPLAYAFVLHRRCQPARNRTANWLPAGPSRILSPCHGRGGSIDLDLQQFERQRPARRRLSWRSECLERLHRHLSGSDGWSYGQKSQTH